MKIFDKLFRRQEGLRDIVAAKLTEIQGNAQENSKTAYYVETLKNVEDLTPIIKKEDFQKVIEEIPNGKVVAFFNMQLLSAANERHFVALDDYINGVKEKQMEKAFYRGLRHGGPCILYAFTKNNIPNNFDGSCFFECPAVVMYF